MPIVKWPIPIIGKLADNQPILIIGAPLIRTLETLCMTGYRKGKRPSRLGA